MTSGYVAVLFISIGQMPFLLPTLDDAVPLFALKIMSGFYLHHGGRLRSSYRQSICRELNVNI